MKISYDILKQFIKVPKAVTGHDLANAFTMHTVEVESFTDFTERLKGAVVGLVTEVKPHPQADKLKLATADIGRKSLEVVCGGVNLKQGMKVAFANVGTLVRWHGQKDWAPLEKATIRGVESAGMACAAEELDIPDANAIEHGIMDLSGLEAIPGTPLADALGISDIILDVDNKSITHRPDLWGHLGLARELAAIWQVPFTILESASVQGKPDIQLKVSISEPKYCQRYLGVVMAGLKVTASPDWLKNNLLKLNMRPINNIVDVTNYVMLELGQPLHAFDLGKLASPEIIVRLAKSGEKLITIDGLERKLDHEELVIADKKQAQAIAGVMGGAGSEVSEGTTIIVLESATFDLVNIRQTASKLGLRTEASARFEKSLDPALAELAMKRTVELMLEVCPSAKVVSHVADAYPKVAEPTILNLNLSWLNKRLGCELPQTEVINILERLGFTITKKAEDLVVQVPSWRATRDITIPEDLIEEVARIYGYDKIPLTMPMLEISPSPAANEQGLRFEIRDILVGAGWVETLSYSFVGARAGGELELENPVDKTRAFLRPSLLASFAEQFEAARRASGKTVKMFELGRVFHKISGNLLIANKSKEKLPHQPWCLVLATYERDRSFRVLKGAIELIEEELGVTLKPKYEELFGGYTAEMEIDVLQPDYSYEFKPLPKYPVVERDISILHPGTTWGEIEKELRTHGKLNHEVKGFDVYEVGGGQSSTTATITFFSPERTLKSEEVDAEMVGLIKLLKDKFNTTIR